jgi:hypothetical protein
MGIMPSRAVRYQGAKVQRPPRANRHEVPRCLFWNNGDDPSRTNFLFHGLNQANELRPAQGYCGWEANILGTTAPLGLYGVIRLDHLHGAQRP